MASFEQRIRHLQNQDAYSRRDPLDSALNNINSNYNNNINGIL